MNQLECFHKCPVCNKFVVSFKMHVLNHAKRGDITVKEYNKFKLKIFKE